MPTQSFTPHVKITFGGTWIDATEEQWVCGLHFEAFADDLTYQSHLSSISSAFQTWFSAAASGISRKAELQFLKAAKIAATGLYDGADAMNEINYAAGITGGADHLHPGTSSLCVTLETQVLWGRARRGRIYLPNPTYAMATAMRVSSADALKAAHSVAGLIDILSGQTLSGSPPTRCIVASGLDAATNVVVATSADDIYDTQHRRNNKVRGGRVFVGLP